MARGSWLRKFLTLAIGSSILLGVQCPPIAIDSVKTGVYTWVSGSFGLLDLAALSDLIIGSNTGGHQPGSDAWADRAGRPSTRRCGILPGASHCPRRPRGERCSRLLPLFQATEFTDRITAPADAPSSTTPIRLPAGRRLARPGPEACAFGRGHRGDSRRPARHPCPAGRSPPSTARAEGPPLWPAAAALACPTCRPACPRRGSRPRSSPG